MQCLKISSRHVIVMCVSATQLCSTAILEAYDSHLKPGATLADTTRGDTRIMELREKFRIALESVQALMPLHRVNTSPHRARIVHPCFSFIAASYHGLNLPSTSLRM